MLFDEKAARLAASRQGRHCAGFDARAILRRCVLQHHCEDAMLGARFAHDGVHFSGLGRELHCRETMACVLPENRRQMHGLARGHPDATAGVRTQCIGFSGLAGGWIIELDETKARLRRRGDRLIHGRRACGQQQCAERRENTQRGLHLAPAITAGLSLANTSAVASKPGASALRKLM